MESAKELVVVVTKPGLVVIVMRTKSVVACSFSVVACSFSVVACSFCQRV
jgi:hypothetical protein